MGNIVDLNMKVDREMEVTNHIYRRLGESLKEMIASAPVDKLKHKLPDLAAKLLVASFHRDCLRSLPNGNQGKEIVDDMRRNLSTKLPATQHLCSQLSEQTSRTIAALVPTLLHNDSNAVKLMEVSTHIQFHSQRLEKTISEISEILKRVDISKDGRSEGNGITIPDIKEILKPKDGTSGSNGIIIPDINVILKPKDGLSDRNNKKRIWPEEIEGTESTDDESMPNRFKRAKTNEKEEVSYNSHEENPISYNSYEENFRSGIIPPDEIDVALDDIGALVEIKKLIYELVILPVKRPNLFKGGLLKPCKGVLLFGPPGTGKTMVAKAIAKESGANFINVSSASLFGMWMGESEKNVKALFTLAEKVAPAVIFVEVDSILGRRKSNDYDSSYRRVKNDIMALWDGIATKDGKQILVMGATNRPFDLDEAIVRRFERRILVDLPCVNSRELILRKILTGENVEHLDFNKLATATEGYSGSDLKNLCKAAAYQPLRELLEQEKFASKEPSTKDNSTLRPLNMDDMLKRVKKQVGENALLVELRKWNELYGEGNNLP